MNSIDWGALIAGAAFIFLWGSYVRYAKKHPWVDEAQTPENEEINVGITTARLILTGGDDAVLTVPGQRLIVEGKKYAFTSDLLFTDLLLSPWITVDDGRTINRDQIRWFIDKKTKDWYI